jgi:KDO2-lipid IV(A) lauroyltransferase
MKALMVTKHLKPEWLHRRLEKVRRSAEVRGTYEPRTLKDVLKELSQGGTVGFVLDQYAGPPVGIRVPFFGVPVGTQTAVAILAKRTGAAVLPIRNHRTKDGVIEIRIDPPVPWVEAGDQTLAVMTAKYTEILEEHIREVPGQWLWVHRRFKGDLSPLRREEWSEARPKR